MALPTQKRTKSSKKKRGFHLRIKKISLSSCPKCQKPVLPYQVCHFCGTYKGREVIKKKDRKKRKKEKVS
jgi:large subunit ribosomal protein L32